MDIKRIKELEEQMRDCDRFIEMFEDIVRGYIIKKAHLKHERDKIEKKCNPH